MMKKSQIRKQIIEQLAVVDHQPLQLYQRLFASSTWQNAKSIAVTNSTALELDTKPIRQQALHDGKQILMPRVLPHHKMEFVEIDANTQFQLSSFKIMEPVTGNVVTSDQIDVIIVPGLGFSEQTHDRLGFGGGFYDRYLEHYNGITLALALTVQHFDRPIWTVGDYDVKVQQILFE